MVSNSLLDKSFKEEVIVVVWFLSVQKHEDFLPMLVLHRLVSESSDQRQVLTDLSDLISKAHKDFITRVW
jgi:hypothetical protein